jgi:hypothetical protein
MRPIDILWFSLSFGSRRYAQRSAQAQNLSGIENIYFLVRSFSGPASLRLEAAP